MLKRRYDRPPEFVVRDDRATVGPIPPLRAGELNISRRSAILAIAVCLGLLLLLVFHVGAGIILIGPVFLALFWLSFEVVNLLAGCRLRIGPDGLVVDYEMIGVRWPARRSRGPLLAITARAEGPVNVESTRFVWSVQLDFRRCRSIVLEVRLTSEELEQFVERLAQLCQTLIHPRCTRCGYDMHGLEKPICPECGAELSTTVFSGEPLNPPPQVTIRPPAAVPALNGR